MKRTRWLWAVLLAATLLALSARGQAPGGVRVLKVKAVADEAFRGRDKWEKEIREYIETADREFRKFAGVGLELVAVESWTTHRTDDMSLMLEELRHSVDKGQADIVVGFTGLAPPSFLYPTLGGGGGDWADPDTMGVPATQRIVLPHILGLAMPLGDRVVVRRSDEKKETRHTILHEISHLFGGLHVRDKSILYVVAGPQDFVLDAFNQRVFDKMRQRDFNRQIQDVPREELDQLIVLYRQRPLKGERDFLNNLYVGYLLAAAGRVDEAVKEFEEAIRIDPREARSMLDGALIPSIEAALEEHGATPESRYTLGRAYATTGRNNKAAQYLGANCFSATPHAPSCSELGALMVQNGAVQQAERVLKRALEYDDTLVNAHTNLGIAYAVQHRTDDALAEFNRALELKPDDARVYFNLGVAYLTLQLLDPAADSFRHALELAPGYDDARSRLAVTLARQGKFPQARETIKPVEESKEVIDFGIIKFEITRITPMIYRDLAEIYFRAGDPKKAWKYLGAAKKGGFNVTELEQQMVAGTPKPQDTRSSDLVEQGRAYFANKRYDLARRLLEQARDKDPSNAEAHYWLARVADAENKPDEAAQHLQDALKLKPKYASAYLELARVEFDRKDFAGSLGHLKRYLDLEEDPVAEAYFLMGACHYHQDNLPGAEESLKKAIRTDTDYGDAFYFLATVYTKQKRADEALAELNLAVGMRSLSSRYRPEAHFNLAVLYLKAEKYDQAWKHARIAERLGYADIGWVLAELAKASPEPAAASSETPGPAISVPRRAATNLPYQITRAEIGDPPGTLNAGRPIHGRVWLTRGPDATGRAVVSLKLRPADSRQWEQWLFVYLAIPEGYTEKELEVVFPWPPNIPSPGALFGAVVVVSPPEPGSLPQAMSNEFPLELKVKP